MLLAATLQYFFGISIFIASGFLILLVLVQRGRGGGLTGALGGPGGQSAFGTKAGDLFTKITIGIAAAWIFLCAASVYFLKAPALPSTGLSSSPSVGSTENAGTENAGTENASTDTDTGEESSDEGGDTDAPATNEDVASEDDAAPTAEDDNE